MLTAFEAQLLSLATDNKDRFHAEIRKRVGKKATPALEEQLKELILRTPKHVKSIYYYWNHRDSRPQTKAIGGFVLSYLYNPRDFLPSETYGLFGYLDDAYLIALVYEQVLWDAKIQDIKISSYEDKFLDEMKSIRSLIQKVIPEESKMIEKMFDELSRGQQTQYANSFEGSNSSQFEAGASARNNRSKSIA